MNRILAVATLSSLLASGSAIADSDHAPLCEPAFGMVETQQTETGNSGTAWIKTPIGVYSGRLIGTVTAADPGGLPTEIRYSFRSRDGVLRLTGTPRWETYADMSSDRYVLALDLTIDKGKLGGMPVVGAFSVALAVNTALNDERGTISSGTVCH